MGLLSLGTPLSWDETKKYAKYVKERGILQFINIYNSSKDRADGPFKYGDEIEYILVKFDHRKKVARTSLRASEIIQKLEDQKSAAHERGPKSVWHPEFAAYMIESTPASPYGGDGLLVTSLSQIEENMHHRRREVLRVLDKDESVMSITNFPRTGCPGFTHPITIPKPESNVSGSIFFPDEAIFGSHPRFLTLHKNIVSRRGRNLSFGYPIYRDKYTPDPFIEQETQKISKPNQVFMDSMGFGMGCCCLQVTFQATHIEEAKILYDQLTPMAPIGLALSAASPIWRGYLTDRDCRWAAVSCSVDDRTPEECGETEELKESKFRIPKSRFDSVSLYLSRHGQKYNDLPLVYDKKLYELMVENDVEPAVARHIAHLFIRDPISLFKEKLDQRDDGMDHFENIQSTNWQSARFKPPPSANSSIGWRVEYRPLEVQPTDFENAAFIVFITLLTRVILAYKLNFLIPLSLVDENMLEAQKRDAIGVCKFWFRSNIMHKSSSKGPLRTVLHNCCDSRTGGTQSSNNSTQSQHSVENLRVISSQTHLSSETDVCAIKMTINEIINGCKNFIGILPIIYHYIESLNDGSNTQQIEKIKTYLKFISDRASLKVRTTSRLIRDFVDVHPKYARNSVVTDEINYDLLCMLDRMGKGELKHPY